MAARLLVWVILLKNLTSKLLLLRSRELAADHLSEWKPYENVNDHKEINESFLLSVKYGDLSRCVDGNEALEDSLSLPQWTHRGDIMVKPHKQKDL
ncbi:hypothetical protein Tco_0785725 [Tanacetum coccineum]